jgi:hypothetical protein
LETSKTANTYPFQVNHLIRYGVFILTSLFLAKSNIGLTAIGHYETFILVSSVFVLLSVSFLLQMPTTLSKENHQTSQKVIVFNAFVVLSLLAFLGAVVCFLFGKSITDSLAINNAPYFSFILGAYLFFATPAVLVEHIYFVNSRSRSLVIYGSVIFVAQLLAVILPLFFETSLNAILIGLLVVAVGQYIWLLFVLCRYVKLEFDLAFVVNFFKLKPHGWIASLQQPAFLLVDGLIILILFSPDQLAIFKFGAHELPMVLLWGNSLHVYLLYRFDHSKTDSPFAEMRAETARLNWTLLPIAMVFIFTSHWFFPLVFSPLFEPSATIFNCYLLLMISHLLFPQTLLEAKGNGEVLVRASLVALFVKVGSGLFLALQFGIIGVVFSTLIAFLCEKIYLVIACKRLLNIDFEKYTPTRLYFVFSMLTAAIFVFVEFILY